jgi:hypothetical protein
MLEHIHIRIKGILKRIHINLVQILSEDDKFAVPISAHIVSDEEYRTWEAQGGALAPEVRYMDMLPVGHTLKVTRQSGSNKTVGAGARVPSASGSRSKSKNVPGHELLGDLGMTLGDAVALAKMQRKELAAPRGTTGAGKW